MAFDIHALIVINRDDIACLYQLEAYDLVEAYNEGRLKGTLKEIAAELEEESNPVIMVIRNKK